MVAGLVVARFKEAALTLSAPEGSGVQECAITIGKTFVYSIIVIQMIACFHRKMYIKYVYGWLLGDVTLREQLWCSMFSNLESLSYHVAGS